MRVIIVGCGKVGRSITEQLSIEGHEIAVIDIDSRAVNETANDFDVLGVVGNGASYSIQIDAGIEEADLLIAVTDSDELNLLCCMIGKKAKDLKTIARVRNPAYNSELVFIKQELGLSMIINPEYAAATEISRLLRFPSAIKIDTFSKGKVELLEFAVKEGSILDGASLIGITKRLKADVLVCGVERGEEVIIPNGRFVLQSGDIITLVASPTNSRLFFREIGLDTQQVKDALIIGGGKVGYYLASLLISMGIQVKIIEVDTERCEQLSGLLPQAVIINGDASDQELLIEEGIDHCAAFITLTGMDEGNIFLSLFAKSRTDAKIVTKINHISFDSIVNTFQLGSIICPKSITADYIVRYARALENSIGSNVETLYKVINKKAEALEFVINKDCPFTGVPLEQLKLKDNLLIASINHNGTISTPRGKSFFSIGDTVVVVTTQKGLCDIRDILRG